MVKKIWRRIVSRQPHPNNGRGIGGCIINTVFCYLDCGHRKTYAMSGQPKRDVVACDECLKEQDKRQ